MRNILVIIVIFILFVSGCAGGPSSGPSSVATPVPDVNGGVQVEIMSQTVVEICDGESLRCAAVVTQEITVLSKKLDLICIREISIQMRGTGISTQCWPQQPQ